MLIQQFHRITDRLDEWFDGEGYYCNWRTRGGHVWLDYTWSRVVSDDIVELSRDGKPPVWLPISEIESIELAGASGEDADV